MKVVELTSKKASDFLLPRHYSGRKPSISAAFGWVDDTGELKAVATFGKPASPYLCKEICGEEYAEHVYELNRLCRTEDLREPLSQFIAGCLKLLRSRRWIIVSFSDMAMNHHGYVYQACNFIYTGATKGRRDTWSGKHARHYTQADMDAGKMVIRSVKHRYVYFNSCDRRENKAWREALKYASLPYPKGDNDLDYEAGYTLKQTIVKRRRWVTDGTEVRNAERDRKTAF